MDMASRIMSKVRWDATRCVSTKSWMFWVQSCTRKGEGAAVGNRDARAPPLAPPTRLQPCLHDG